MSGRLGREVREKKRIVMVEGFTYEYGGKPVSTGFYRKS
jgi:hypothetical protein